jgi:hypothetical protein
MIEKKPARRVRRSRVSGKASGDAITKGDIVTESDNQSAALATETIVVPATGGDAVLARLHRLNQLAMTAIVLSVIGVVAALTVPLWSPKLYGNPDSSRFVALGVAQLRPFLQKEEPFGVQLSTLQRVIPNDPDLAKALETLAAFADSGAPILPHLHDRFVRMANQIMLANVVSAKNTWLDRAVVTVASTLDLHSMAHRLNDPRDASLVVWDAQAHLDSGDLAGAVGALSMLTGRPAEVARPWIAQANQRLAADKVLAQLDTLAEALAAGNRQSQLTN